MKKVNTDNWEEISKYRDGDMGVVERLNFEKRLQTDKQLKEDYKTYQQFGSFADETPSKDHK
jgi:cell fate (sporulation/competence/biofilm development) regulator YlbF (YheA/YmcA/DUF963 family)